jgi:Fungal specific transcription factor domain
MDHALVFPICLAGSMSDNTVHRDFCKGRLSLLDGGVGNPLQVRLAMEAIWQKRDLSGSAVELREVVRERGLHLLLV